MSRIKKNWIKDNKIEKNKLYTIKTNITIPFKECYEEGDFDIVEFEFNLNKSEYGIYGHEFKPPFLDKDSCKTADILCLIINEEEQKFTSYIMDVKRDVGGEDVIYHLIEQLQESYLHKESVTTYLKGFNEKEFLGVITRNFDIKRISNTIDSKNTQLNNTSIRVPTIILAKKQNLNLKLEQSIKILELFRDKKIQIYNKVYDLNVIIMNESKAKMTVCNI